MSSPRVTALNEASFVSDVYREPDLNRNEPLWMNDHGDGESSLMLRGIRDFLNTPAGKVSGLVLVLAGIAIAAFSTWSTYGASTPSAPSKFTYICSETGKTFQVSSKEGMKFPVDSPFSGKATGYPATPCFWNKDGTIRSSPNWVLLNETKGAMGPTFCPECGRLVEQNPREPAPGERPPPTKAEYERLRMQ